MKETQLAQALGLYSTIREPILKIKEDLFELRGSTCYPHSDIGIITYCEEDDPNEGGSLQVTDDWKLRLRPLSDMTVEEANQLGIEGKITSIDSTGLLSVFYGGFEGYEDEIGTLYPIGIFEWHIIAINLNLTLPLTRMGFDLGLLPPERVELISNK
jgi:hypothetical protein